MVANELRIGNWVFHVPTGGPRKGCHDPLKVKSINDLGINLFSSGGQYGEEEVLAEADFNELKPIPLSRELLEVCGFVTVPRNAFTEDNVEIMEHPQLKGVVYKNARFYCDLGTEMITNALAHVNDLHHLQNLYYAITGYEIHIPLLRLNNKEPD